MSLRRSAILSIFAVCLALVYLAAWRYLSLDMLAQQEQRLRATVKAHGVASWLVGLAVYVVVSLVPGTGGKAMVFGWLFGFLPALAIVNLGLTAAAADFVYGRPLSLSSGCTSAFQRLDPAHRRRAEP